MHIYVLTVSLDYFFWLLHGFAIIQCKISDALKLLTEVPSYLFFLNYSHFLFIMSTSCEIKT